MTVGTAGRFLCSFNGIPTGVVYYRILPDELEITFSRHRESPRLPQRIEFSYTSQTLGGTRRWLICPKCGGRCLTIYGHQGIGCRKCQGLTYESQQQGPEWRALVRAQKHRQKLGGSGDVDEPFPARPRRMHRRTYERAIARAVELDQEVFAVEHRLERRLSAIK